MAGKLSLSMSPVLKWTDEKLKWNPKLHSGVNSLILPLEDIWYPKLDLTNPYSNTKLQTNDDAVRVYANGAVVMGKVFIYESICFINVQYYPFDTQVSRQTRMMSYLGVGNSFPSRHSSL